MKTEKCVWNDLLQKWVQCNAINLQRSPQYVLLISSNVPLRHKFLWRRSIFVAVPVSHAPPSLPSSSMRRRVCCVEATGWYSENVQTNLLSDELPLSLESLFVNIQFLWAGLHYVLSFHNKITRNSKTKHRRAHIYFYFFVLPVLRTRL